LKVEDTFLIKGRGLVLIPNLPLPTTGKFDSVYDKVVVLKPDGTEREFEAKFMLEHFSLVGGGSKWSIVVLLSEASKADVPAGSEIMVSEDTLASIRNGSI